MALKAAVFLTQRDLDIFGRFVTVEEGMEGKVMSALDAIGSSICRSARNSGAEAAFYVPEDLSKLGTILVGQISLKSAETESGLLIEAIDGFISDMHSFRKIDEIG